MPTHFKGDPSLVHSLDTFIKVLKSTGNITLVINNLKKRGLVRRVR